MTATVQLRGSALHGILPPGVSPAMFAGLPQTVALGRVRPKAPPQVLRLSKYLRRAAVPLPASSGNRRAKAGPVLSRMYRNDARGCCVIADQYHSLGFWSANDNGPDLQVPDSTIDAVYDRLKAGPGDSGCVITDVLDYFKATGLPVNGGVQKIDGYVAVDNTNVDEVKTAILLFGSLTLGLNLPDDWTQNAVWDVTGSQIVGGHDVPAIDYEDNTGRPGILVGFDQDGVYISSWGRVYLMTWRAFTSRNWVEEAYARLAPAWYGSDKLSPLGVDAATLLADLQKLGGGELPPLPGPTPPAPPTPQPPVPPMPTPTYPTYAVTLHVPYLGTATGTAVPQPSGNDRFRAEFAPAGLGFLDYLRLLRQVQAFIAWLQQYLNQPQTAAAAFPSIPPAVIQLILANALKLVPVIIAGLQKGETFQQILQDCLKEILPAAPLPSVAGV